MDPYRVLFPLGTLAAVAGTISWVSFGLGLSQTYPGASHPFVMIAVFLFAFVSGFLMTAIPQFTGSRHCEPVELGVAAFLVLLLYASARGEGPGALSFALFAVSIAALSVFCARRFLTRSYAPPRTFLFVGLGLLMGFAGSLLLLAGGVGWAEGGPVILGRLFLYHGMVLALIAGVGTQLLPAIWGWSELPIQITRFHAPSSPLRALAPTFLLALAFLGSYGVEAFLSPSAGRALRALLVSVLAIWNWKILRRPKARTKLAFWLWISAWSLLAGLWVPVIQPDLLIHGLHLCFIGGFGLMTLMIASRVTLAHGGYGLQTEARSRLLTAASVLILLAALTRFSAGILPSIYLRHLAYAAVAWILGLLLWALALVPKMARLHQR